MTKLPSFIFSFLISFVAFALLVVEYDDDLRDILYLLHPILTITFFGTNPLYFWLIWVPIFFLLWVWLYLSFNSAHKEKLLNKSKSIQALDRELSQLIDNNISLIATAYEKTVKSDSFGTKDYSKFVMEFSKYLLSNTNSPDIKKHVSEIECMTLVSSNIYKIDSALEKLDA